MRFCSVVGALALLFSSAVFAQHSSTGGAPSSPPSAAPSSPPPAPASGPSSTGPSSTSASGTSSSANSSHSEGSNPSPPSGSSSSRPSVGNSSSVSSHVSNAPASESSASHSAAHPPTPRTSETTSERITPEPKIVREEKIGGEKISEEKIGGEEKIVTAPRIGEKPLENDKEERTGGSDLRRPACKDGTCKEGLPKQPAESDLRRPVCNGKPCACPPGEAPGKNGGCVAAPINNSGACAADEYWNGTSCVARLAECASVGAQASALANQVRAAKAQMQNVCSAEPSGQDCSDFRQNYDGAVERYRVLQNAAPTNCRTMLLDPLAL
jgi:hypothetical protein